MIPRLKLFTAALGLVVAAGTIGDASARVIDRTVFKKTIVTRSVTAPHRAVLLPRGPVFHRFVAYRAPILVRTQVVGRRLVHAPIVVKRHALLHRTIVRKTVIR